MSAPDVDRFSTRHRCPVRCRSSASTWPTYPLSGLGAPSPWAVESPSTTQSGPDSVRTR